MERLIDKSVEGNSTKSLSTIRKRIFDRTHLIINPNREQSQSRKFKFGEEARITAGILPSLISLNITKQRSETVDNNRGVNQIQSTPIPFIRETNDTSTTKVTVQQTTTNLPEVVSASNEGL